MLENFTKKLAEKMGKSVKATIEPKVDSKIDLYSKILRFGVLVFLFIEGTKKVTNDNSNPVNPNQIVINNYLYERKE